jgi:hypothetical protein
MAGLKPRTMYGDVTNSTENRGQMQSLIDRQLLRRRARQIRPVQRRREPERDPTWTGLPVDRDQGRSDPRLRLLPGIRP